MFFKSWLLGFSEIQKNQSSTALLGKSLDGMVFNHPALTLTGMVNLNGKI